MAFSWFFSSTHVQRSTDKHTSRLRYLFQTLSNSLKYCHHLYLTGIKEITFSGKHPFTLYTQKELPLALLSSRAKHELCYSKFLPILDTLAIIRVTYRGADKSLARSGRKQDIAAKLYPLQASQKEIQTVFRPTSTPRQQ